MISRLPELQPAVDCLSLDNRFAIFLLPTSFWFPFSIIGLKISSTGNIHSLASRWTIGLVFSYFFLPNPRNLATPFLFCMSKPEIICFSKAKSKIGVSPAHFSFTAFFARRFVPFTFSRFNCEAKKFPNH